MPAIDSMMKRLGFVRLSRYGLVLTPEGRIISLRPAVLDDGTGGRVVGWEDDDLAAMELGTWSPEPAARRAVATPVASAPPRVVVSMPAFTPPTPSPVLEVMTIPVAPPAVASTPHVEEDDWEWEIALARARAAAEESEVAASKHIRTTRPMLATKSVPDGGASTDATSPSSIGPTSTDSARPAPGYAVKAWPKTEPLGTIDYEDYSSSTREIVRVARGAEPPPQASPARSPSTVAAAQPAAKVVRVPTPSPVKSRPVTISQPAIATKPVVTPTPRTSAPTTIIPVPKLATVQNPQLLAPVVRTTAPLPSLPRRLAKGTGPVEPKPAPMTPQPPVVAPNATPVGRSKLPSIVQRAR